MGMVGIEAVVDAIVTKLQSDMPAKVAALNAAYADTHVLLVPTPANYYTELPDPIVPTFTSPAIVVRQSTDRANLPESNPEMYLTEYNVQVDVVVRSKDAHDLSRLLMRYTRAIKEILVARHALAPTCTMCMWSETDWRQPLYTNPKIVGLMLKDVPSLFWVRTAESTT